MHWIRLALMLQYRCATLLAAGIIAGITVGVVICGKPTKGIGATIILLTSKHC